MPPAPNRLSTLKVLRAFVVCSLVAPLLLFAVAAWYDRDRLEIAAEERAERTVLALSEHALRVFEGHEMLLHRIDERIGALEWASIRSSPDLQAWMAALTEELPQVESIGVIDPDGRLAVTSREFPAPALEVSHRDFFRIPRQSPDEGTFVDKVVEGRMTGERLFRLSRARRPAAGGDFNGVIFASVTPEYLTEFYRSVAGGEDSVTVARADGAVLVREPPVTTGVETLGPESGLMRSVAGDPEGGTYRTTSTLDGVERIHAYAHVSGWPVYVSYGYSLTNVAGQWWRDLAASGLIAASASVLLSGVGFLAMRRARSEQDALLRLREEAGQREHAETQLRQLQKMEAVGQLTGGIAHDFNNMLAVVLGALNLLERRLARGDTNVQRFIDSAKEGAERAAGLTQRLLAFSRQQSLSPEPIDASRLVSGMSDLMRRTIREDVRIETVLAEGLWPVHVDRLQLENAILNLALNARDAMPDGGRLTVETENRRLDAAYASQHADLKPGPYVMIAVTDTGTGMPQEVIARAFDPFFTTKEVGKGTGLGLSQVFGFVKQSGGHLKIYSEVGHGTAVKIYLPALPGPPVEALPPRRAGAADAAPGGADGIVLVVEDDAAVRKVSVEALRELGYRVLEAEDGDAALGVLRSDAPLSILFTDVVMPGMNGQTLAHEALKLRPGLKVLFTTGYTETAMRHNGMIEPGVHVIGKPFTVDQLARKLQSLFEADSGSTNLS